MDWAGELGVSKIKASTMQNCRDYISGSGSLIHYYVHDLNVAGGDYLKKQSWRLCWIWKDKKTAKTLALTHGRPLWSATKEGEADTVNSREMPLGIVEKCHVTALTWNRLLIAFLGSYFFSVWQTMHVQLLCFSKM